MKRWSDDDNLMLLTPDELLNLPAGAKLTSINGETMLYDPKNPPDGDTRYGVLAWGLIDGKAEFVL